MTSMVRMLKHEKSANSRMAEMRFTSKDPSPMIVVPTASDVGRASATKVEWAASAGEPISLARKRYSVKIYMQ